jgi:hypothetical protein
MDPLQASVSGALWHDMRTFGVALFAWYKTVLPFLKILSLIVSGLLLWGIWYARKMSGYGEWKADQWRDRIGKRDLPQVQARRAWRAIRADIAAPASAESWARALKNAEGLVQEGLRINGYMANTDDERLRIAREAGETAIGDAYIAARSLAQRMNIDARAASREEAIDALRAYKRVIQALGLL